jgi:uncharacterized alpha-E superfamily protein
MLSRVADSVYWMSRYVERAENLARFIQVNFNLMLDAPPGVPPQWAPLISTTGDDAAFAERYAEPSEANVIHFLTFDEENPSAILSSLRAARENARSVREIISSEMWEQLNTTYLFVRAAAADPRTRARPQEFYTRVKEAGHLFCGITDATLTHNEAWHFIRLGRMLERADKTSRNLDVKYFLLLRSAADVGTPFDEIQWAAVLRATSAFEMYRKKHGRIAPSAIVEFLLLNDEFPRAILHCLNRARASLQSISGTPPGSPGNLGERLLGRLCSDLTYTSVEEVIQAGLHEYLDDLQTRLNRVGTAVHSTFFALRVPEAAGASRHGRLA